MTCLCVPVFRAGSIASFNRKRELHHGVASVSFEIGTKVLTSHPWIVPT